MPDALSLLQRKASPDRKTRPAVDSRRCPAKSGRAELQVPEDWNGHSYDPRPSCYFLAVRGTSCTELRLKAGVHVDLLSCVPRVPAQRARGWRIGCPANPRGSSYQLQVGRIEANCYLLRGCEIHGRSRIVSSLGR